MEKVHAAIKELGYDELLALRGALGTQTRELVEERIKAFENPHLVCPVCSSPIDPHKDITLHFGPQGLRYRASFDGYDCLAAFVNDRKNRDEQEKQDSERE